MAVVVERDQSCVDCLVFTWPSTVPPSAEVVCGPDEVAVVCSNWKVDSELGPGRHTLRLSQPLLQAAIYFVRTAAVSVPFGTAAAVIDRGTGQVVQLRLEGSLLCRVAEPALLCWQVVGVPVRDLDAGVIRSIRTSAEKILHRVISKACIEQPVASVMNPVTLGEVVRRTVEANPVAIAVTGIEFLQFETLTLTLPTGVTTSWRSSIAHEVPTARLQFGGDEPTEEQEVLEADGEPSQGSDAAQGQPERADLAQRPDQGPLTAVSGEIPDRSAQPRRAPKTARGAAGSGQTSPPAAGADSSSVDSGPGGRPVAAAGGEDPAHVGPAPPPPRPGRTPPAAAGPTPAARLASPTHAGLDRQAAAGHDAPRSRRPTTPVAGVPPPPARRRTPPLGSLAAPLPPAAPRQPGQPPSVPPAVARHEAPTVKNPVLSGDPALAPGASPIPAGSQVLVYGLDGLWHAATVRQYQNGQYEVIVGDSSTVAWVPASRIRS